MFIERSSFATLFRKSVPLLDVRAEAEFAGGTVPTARNLPILTDNERAKVGLCYKEHGQCAAIELGHRLVNEGVRASRISTWEQFFRETTSLSAAESTFDTIGSVLYCARGGLRSEIAQRWLWERGIYVRRIRGGYKALRNFLLESLEQQSGMRKLLVLSGYTGSGKTAFLHDLGRRGRGVIDLEGIARHRGSAFGQRLSAQPAQATFENCLAVSLLGLPQDNCPVLIEDESRLIGIRHIPQCLYDRMNKAPLLILEIPLEARIDRIINDYVLDQLKGYNEAGEEDPFKALEQHLKNAVHKLRKHLGDLRARRLLRLIETAIAAHGKGDTEQVHRHWIEPLLTEYYDRFYEYHLQKNKDRILMRGSAEELFFRLEKYIAASRH